MTRLPAAASSSAFQAAPSPPPASATSRPCSLKNAGRVASGRMASIAESVGASLSSSGTISALMELLDGNVPSGITRLLATNTFAET